MREAIGNSFVIYFIVTFFALFILVFLGSLAYTKAFKVKNRIVDIIEDYDGEIANGNRLKADVQTEIDDVLGEIGYRIDNDQTCKTDGRFDDMASIAKNSNYRYCIYMTKTTKGNYYSVVTYMYFEIPIIGSKLEFPVYGETKVFTKI